ncbi:MAG: hypothetical protein HQL56_16305 [Magnetococcales bacterium]|nr:hypothetical protein [Magnetococcales bacterium]
MVFSLLLASCGGGGGGDSGGYSSSSGSSGSSSGSSSGRGSSTLTTAAPGSTPSTAFNTALGGGVYQSDAGLLTLPANALSFVLHLQGSSVGTRTRFNALKDPNGSTVSISHADCPTGAQYCNLLVPQKPGVSVTTGQWQYWLQSNSSSGGTFSVSVSTRAGTLSGGAYVTVQPYLTGTRFTTAQVSAAMERLRSTYANNGVTVTVNTPITISGSSYASVSTNYNNSTTGALISQGSAGVVNLFFVEDFLDGDTSLLGLVPNIPGSLGVAGNYDGFLINVSAHLVGVNLDTSFLGDTAAHEMGHFMGLYHTTESDGSSYDILDDTPRCTTDTNRDGLYSLSECLNSDGHNLMFWQGSSGTDQTTLTSDQQHVLRYSPIAQ